MLINNIMSNDKTAADACFKDILIDKVKTALDVKQVELASTLYNVKNEH